MNKKKNILTLLTVFALAVVPFTSWAQVYVQCPTLAGGSVLGDVNGDGFIRAADGEILLPLYPGQVCLHITAGDGFINMADGKVLYAFGFANMTGHDPAMIMDMAMLTAELPAPTITLKEGEQLFLTLTNVGMIMRPDLFDPHTIHWHGFPNASSIFDGEPMSAISINMGASLTYFYNVVEPGTYMYHCHVEATEHMQMGMLGNLYVTPAQDGDTTLKNLGSVPPLNQPYAGFAYKDDDGSTGYHKPYPIQIHAFDPDFHDASISVQPLNFAGIFDSYGMLNGRGYPDTINTGELGQSMDNMDYPSQKINSLITATRGQKILLRISNLSFDYYTLSVLGIPMKVVGKDAKILRGPMGNLYYDTHSIDLGGGETADVILDTANVDAGTYFFYTTNLNYLSNNKQDRGGMMTEIVIQ